MRRLLSLALTFAMAWPAVAAHAQTAWPAKPIRLLVGFAAGGSTDVTARIIGQALSERLGQPIIIENRPGAGGNIAADAAAKADPDGYTLMLTTSTTFATNPSLYKSLPYDVQTDFSPIALTAFIPKSAGRPSIGSGQQRRGIRRLPEGKPRQAELRLGRQRLLAAYRRRVVQLPRRRAHGPCSLSRRCAGRERPVGRAASGHLRAIARSAAAGAGRQGPGARHHHDEAITAVVRGPHHRRPRWLFPAGPAQWSPRAVWRQRRG